MLASGIDSEGQVGVGKESFQEQVPRWLASTDEGFTLAFLPAVTVGCRRRSLQLAVMSTMADSSTFGATAQRPNQATGSALKDILVDVLFPSPGEAACIVGTKHIQRRVVWQGSSRVQHLGQGSLVELIVSSGIDLLATSRRSIMSSNALNNQKELIGSRVSPTRDGQHKRGVALEVSRRQQVEHIAGKDVRIE